MTPADVLEAAADALFVHGRATGSGRRRDGRMCVLGAVQYVQGRDPEKTLGNVESYRDPARASLERFLVDSCGMPEASAGTGRCAAWAWNDCLQLTPENDAVVIDTLKRCSKALREVES